MEYRRRLYRILEKAEEHDPISRWFDLFIITLIFLNVVAIIAESFEELRAYQLWFDRFEIFSVAVFSIEYILRVGTADLRFPEGHKLKATLRYIVSPMALLDLLAILPFYLPFILPMDLRLLRMLRIIRLFRVFKLNRYYLSFQVLGRVLYDTRRELGSALFISGILLLTSATLMYYAEKEAQPEAFPNILSTLWWAVATLTTVGYGDVYPVTALGRLLGGVVAVFGVGMVALPTGILSAAFLEKLNRYSVQANAAKARGEERAEGVAHAGAAGFNFCPHCGEALPPAMRKPPQTDAKNRK